MSSSVMKPCRLLSHKNDDKKRSERLVDSKFTNAFGFLMTNYENNNYETTKNSQIVFHMTKNLRLLKKNAIKWNKNAILNGRKDSHTIFTALFADRESACICKSY